jgi:molybdenum cofactor cytidylyltransferase
MIGELALRYRRGLAPLVVSEYGGVLAPPILYGRGLFSELEALEGHERGKIVTTRHRIEAIAVPWDPAALTDLDVPADYERARAKLGGR